MAEQVSTGEEVQARTQAMLDETRARAGETVRRVAKESSGFIDNQKRLAGVEVDGYACALHETARILHEQDQHSVADYADRAGDALDRFARTLRDKDIGSMVDNINDFARRQPGIFIGGAVAAGFLLARFMKSSETGVESSAGMKSEEEMSGKAAEASTEKKTSEKEVSGEEHYTSADIEVPVILKPHEPIHPGERRP